MMKIPSDVFLDFANNEMWVASFGNHLALAFKLGASGDTAPVRIVRGSPINSPGALISNPFAWPTTPSARKSWCRAASRNPRIAAFPRTADKNALPVRSIEGVEHQAEPHRALDLLRRDPRRDRRAVGHRPGRHDVPRRRQRQRGADSRHQRAEDLAWARFEAVGRSGQQRADSPSSAAVLLFFDRMANGDVAPKRTLGGPNNRVSIANARSRPAQQPADRVRAAQDFDLRSDRVGPDYRSRFGVITGIRVGADMSYLSPERQDRPQHSRPAGRRARRDRGRSTPEGLASDKSHHRGLEHRRQRQRGAALDDRRPAGTAPAAARPLLDPKNKTSSSATSS